MDSMINETAYGQRQLTRAAFSGRHYFITNNPLTLSENEKMKQLLKLSIAIAINLSSAVLTLAQADDSSVNIKAYFGGKTIDDSAWSSQDGHGSIGILTDVKTGFQDIHVALDLFGSGSEDSTTSQVKGTYMAEAHLGLRKYFDLQSQFRLYIGGGFNFAYATQTNNDGSGKTEEEDMDTGLWLNGGIDYLMTEQITAGVDLRYATSNVELYDESVELDATAIGVSLGYSW